MATVKKRLVLSMRVMLVVALLSTFLMSVFDNIAGLAAANPSQESDQITPGLQAAIQEALGPDALVPATEDVELTAFDGAADDRFGIAVAVSGDTALVGAPYDNSQGAVYIFERDQGGADNWGWVIKFISISVTAGDNFGIAVALSGDTALVGAFGDDANGSSSGAAYIFERDQGGADNWGQVKRLTASDGAAGDNFGAVVALSGDTALVGARFDDDIATASGSAYIFERDQGGTDNWGQAKKLTASDPAMQDYFGHDVALSGDTALIGANFDDDNGANSGSAYIFERDQGGAGNWGQVKKNLPFRRRGG